MYVGIPHVQTYPYQSLHCLGEITIKPYIGWFIGIRRMDCDLFQFQQEHWISSGKLT